MTTTDPWLSPEDITAYQLELLRLMDVRNESLSASWGHDRANRISALNTAAEHFGGQGIANLRETLANEYRIAGLNLIRQIR